MKKLRRPWWIIRKRSGAICAKIYAFSEAQAVGCYVSRDLRAGWRKEEFCAETTDPKARANKSADFRNRLEDRFEDKTMLFCPNCHYPDPLAGQASRCPNCGEPVEVFAHLYYGASF